jgi:hypothetical protein
MPVSLGYLEAGFGFIFGLRVTVLSMQAVIAFDWILLDV